MLTLALIVPGALSTGGASSGAIFTDRDTLIAALAEYNTDSLAAEASYGPINTWNVSGLTTLAWVFCGHASWTHNGCNTQMQTFNGDVSSWDVSRVRSLYNTWNSAALFNQDISRWDTSSLDNSQYGMYGTFGFASAFNQPLRWNVSGVQNLQYTFHGAPMSDCNKAITASYFESSPAWASSAWSSWGSFNCPPSPPLAPSPIAPPPAAPPPTEPVAADQAAGSGAATSSQVTVEAGGVVNIRQGGVLTIG